MSRKNPAVPSEAPAPTITALPSGGSLKLDPRVAEIFLLHLDVLCAPYPSRRYADSKRRCDDLLLRLDDDQRRWARVIAEGLANRLSR